MRFFTWHWLPSCSSWHKLPAWCTVTIVFVGRPQGMLLHGDVFVRVLYAAAGVCGSWCLHSRPNMSLIT